MLDSSIASSLSFSYINYPNALVVAVEY